MNVFAKLKEILPVRLIKESTNKVNFKFKLIKVTPDIIGQAQEKVLQKISYLGHVARTLRVCGNQAQLK